MNLLFILFVFSIIGQSMSAEDIGNIEAYLDNLVEAIEEFQDFYKEFSSIDEEIREIKIMTEEFSNNKDEPELFAAISDKFTEVKNRFAKIANEVDNFVDDMENFENEKQELEEFAEMANEFLEIEGQLDEIKYKIEEFYDIEQEFDDIKKQFHEIAAGFEDQEEESGDSNENENEEQGEVRSLVGGGGTKSQSCYAGYCLNGGVCFGSMNCVCAKGYKGSRCQEMSTKTSCEENPCAVGEICEMVGSSYTCIHPCVPNPCPGGVRCYVQGTTYRCKITDPCVTNPCPPGSRCSTVGTIRTCTSTDPCVTNPCPLGTTCSPLGNFIRNCVPNNPCLSNPCPAGTTCLPVGTSRDCVPNNPCLNNPCPAGTTCLPVGTSRDCVPNNPCLNNPCPLDTQCVPNGQSHECRPSKTACAVNQCRNGCVCTPSCRHEDGYYCKGGNGYIGKKCDIPPPSVSCERSRMLVDVDEAILGEYSPSNNMELVVGFNGLSRENECLLTKYGNRYTISLPVGAGSSICGVVQGKSFQGMQYNATLWIRMRNAMSFDIPIPWLKIVCKYVAEYSVSTSLQPQVALPRMITGQGMVTKGSISLCKVGSSCPSACPVNYLVTGGGVYTVGEMIHLNIRTGSNDPQQKAALERLYLSCDSTMNSLAVVDLINQGCTSATQLHTTISHNAQSDCVCISFQVPKLDNCQQVFIHAKLADCTGRPLETCPASNTQSCVSGTYAGRRKRDLGKDAESSIGIFGPLYFMSIVKTESKSVLFPEKDIVPEDGVLPRPLSSISGGGTYYYLYIVLSIVLVLLICAFVFSYFCFFRLNVGVDKL